MLLLIVLWAIGANWLAYRRGFFSLQKIPSKMTPAVPLKLVLISFGIYLSLAILVSPLLARAALSILHKANPEATTAPIALLTGIQFVVMLIIFAVLQLYIATQDKTAYTQVWKNRAIKPYRASEFDFAMGAATWFLSFPLATLVAEWVDKLTQSVYGVRHYEQAAVKFVKAATESPLALVFAFLSVLVLAPLIEEFLFRGLLQSYFRKRLGAISAILISALTFALFHFSSSQGIGNISLISALFVLGCFLGFLYERQRSLWASIGLHMAFNLISALRIILLPEAA